MALKFLRVFLILLEGVPILFFKSKQIKKFKLYIYIYFFFSGQGVLGNTLTSTWHCHWSQVFLEEKIKELPSG